MILFAARRRGHLGNVAPAKRRREQALVNFRQIT